MNKSIEQLSKEQALEIIKIDQQIQDLIKIKKRLGKKWKKFLKENEINFYDNVEFHALDILGENNEK